MSIGENFILNFCIVNVRVITYLMILCIEVICISYAQNVMYSTPACALAKSPKKICLKIFKMSGRKIFEDCII